jgi:peptidoglycan/xylan/chitin deacetylase (PgdA/CDA1 family)
MNSRGLFSILRRSGLPRLWRVSVQKRRISILVFHRLEADLADRAFAFLKKAYGVIPLSRAVEAIARRDVSGLPPRPLVITFDDGLSSHYGLLPAVRAHGVSVTVFLCAGIVGTNRHFWFLHDAAARHDPGWKRLSHTERLASLRREGFAFETEHADRQALSRAEIEDMKPFVDFQSHSMFHENILTCSADELRRAVVGSKDVLERDFGLCVDAFAYPAGDYGPEQIEMVKRAGYRCAVTNDPGFNSGATDPFLLKRIEALGFYESGTLDEIIVRASGILCVPKTIGLRVRRRLRRRKIPNGKGSGRG